MLFRTLIAAAFLTSATCDRASAAAPAAAPAEAQAPISWGFGAST